MSKELKKLLEDLKKALKESNSYGGKGRFELPDTHKAGMAVPKGGSSCASCTFYEGNQICGNKYWVQWNGSNNIPKPADEYCSDWYEN